MSPRKKTTDVQLKDIFSASAQKALRRLVELMDNENPETARKACVDLLKLRLAQSDIRSDNAFLAGQPLDEATASALLDAVAQALAARKASDKPAGSG